MKPYLFVLTVILGVAVASCSKRKDCGCAPPPPLANTQWKMVQYSGGYSGASVDLATDQQHRLSFGFSNYTYIYNPSGTQTSGSYSSGPAPTGYENSFMIKFDKQMPVLGTGELVVIKNRNDSLVLVQSNIADGYSYTLVRVR
ncbi:MAG: hypothetical protein J7527_14305 [Chitinophagaceae bacterium]|nr:hypothetical protein [Chitinophagaceae bacterium]